MKKILLASCLAILASNVFASVTLLTSRAQITETDYIDWADLGATFTPVPASFVISTHGTPFNVNVSGPGPMERRDEGNGWLGDFTPGDALLWTNSQSGPLTLTGSKTCNEVGMSVQRDQYGAYGMTISAYDGLNNLVGSFHLNGNVGSAEDGSALFAGIRSTAGDIHSVVIQMDDNGDFALNRVSYSCCGPVPEPASMSVLALGALGLLRKKRAR